MPSERAVSEILRRACVGDYETVGDAETNAQEIMEHCHELLAIVEAAKKVANWKSEPLRDGEDFHVSITLADLDGLRASLRAAGEEIE